MSKASFFEDCWTPIYPDDTGDQVNPDVPALSAGDKAWLAARTAAEAPTRHPSSQRFHDLLAEIAELHDRKQADYGRVGDPFYNIRQSVNWGVEPWVGAMLRADDKVGRLRNLVANGGELVNEPIEDSLLDIAVYALIALALRDETGSARSG